MLKRANTDARPDPLALRTALLDLFGVVGRGTSQDDADFRNTTKVEVSHQDLADAFRAIEYSSSPLEEDGCSGQVLIELDRFFRMKRNTRTRRNAAATAAGLRNRVSSDLTPDELEDLRAVANHLEAIHSNRVRRGPLGKGDQDAVLVGLASIFVEFAELNIDHNKLPHSVRSHFTSFCHLAARPFFPLTEMSPSAISDRWKDIKKPKLRPLGK